MSFCPVLHYGRRWQLGGIHKQHRRNMGGGHPKVKINESIGGGREGVQKFVKICRPRLWMPLTQLHVSSLKNHNLTG